MCITLAVSKALQSTTSVLTSMLLCTSLCIAAPRGACNALAQQAPSSPPVVNRPQLRVGAVYEERVELQATALLVDEHMTYVIDGHESSPPPRPEALACTHNRVIVFSDEILEVAGDRIVRFTRSHTTVRDVRVLGTEKDVTSKRAKGAESIGVLEGTRVEYHWSASAKRYEVVSLRPEPDHKVKEAFRAVEPFLAAGMQCPEKEGTDLTARCAAVARILVTPYSGLLSTEMTVQDENALRQAPGEGQGSLSVKSAWGELSLDSLTGSVANTLEYKPRPSEVPGSAWIQCLETAGSITSTCDVSSDLRNAVIGAPTDGVTVQYDHKMIYTETGHGVYCDNQTIGGLYDLKWDGDLHCQEQAVVVVTMSDGGVDRKATVNYSGTWKGAVVLRGSRVLGVSPRK